jgi:hypothetical protein
MQKIGYWIIMLAKLLFYKQRQTRRFD